LSRYIVDSYQKKHVLSTKRENDETPRIVESTLHHPSFYILIMSATEAEAYSNPVRLSVATRESNASAGPSTAAPVLSERERLLKARKSNEVIRRKGEKWADKLMEETVDRDTFKRAVSLFHSFRGDKWAWGGGVVMNWTGVDSGIINHVPISFPPYD